MSVNSSTPLPADVMDFIQDKAKQLVAWYRFAAADPADIEHDIVLEVLRRRAEIDPDHAGDTKLLITLVQHAVGHLIDYRTAAKRDCRRRVRSLDQWVRDEDERWVCLADTLAAVGRGDSGIMSDLRVDLEAAMATLPKPLADICAHLMDGHSVREVAALIGWHHSSVYDALGRVRGHFVEAGLEKYFTGQPDRFEPFPVVNGGRTPSRLLKGQRG